MSGLLGAVLAGGGSVRFGSDKALATWRGKPLIDHVAEALRGHVDAVVVCGRSHGLLRGLQDRPRPGMGPLGGLAAALHHAASRGFDAVITAGCDTPVLPPALLDRLKGEAGAAYLASLPVIGRWPASLSASLDAFLEERCKHAIKAWAELIGASQIDWPELPNVNRPGDLDDLP